MNASYEWLKAFVEFDLTPQELRTLLTARVVAVDELLPLRADLEPIVVARVVECAKHPNADHLSVTKVDSGSGQLLDVVCGAPNVAADKLYPFAAVGTVMPGGLVIERRTIRGAMSEGMLCSARELGLGENHEGILELNVDASPGTPLLIALPVGDVRLVLDVTPNRPDLLSHLGIAREISAALGGKIDLQTLAVRGARDFGVQPASQTAHTPADSETVATGGVRVTLDDPEGAPRYLGVAIRGVRIGPSPEWLVSRLTSVGSRPINNVVDATNYMLHGFGQPMHAFDLAKLAGSRLIVRRARQGEKLITLDGVERALTPEMTVIADAERAHAIAGVIGGRDSEVTEGTTDIFLEVAAFDPVRVRATRKKLNLSTDASYRFERGVDVEMSREWLRYAGALITSVAGGSAEREVDLHPVRRSRSSLTLRVQRVAHLLGEPVSAAEIMSLLRSIGFDVDWVPGTQMLHGEQEFRVTPPSWRADIAREVDLIEEVARLHGYDRLSSALRPYRLGAVPDAPMATVMRRVRDALVAAGLFEVRPMPFVRGAAKGFVKVANPIAENEGYLRTSVLDSLERRAEFNLSHMTANVRLFEVGAIFTPDSGTMPREELRAAALIMGQRRPPHFTEPKPPLFDEWDAKALAQVMGRAAFPNHVISPRPSGAGALWDIDVDGELRGHIRKLSLDSPVWAAPAFGVELTLGVVESADVAPPGTNAHAKARSGGRVPPLDAGGSGGAPRFRPLPTTPAAEFDVALLIPNDMPGERVERVMRSAAGELLEKIALFDEFRGDGVPDGYRSLAWRLTFRHPGRTLRDKEVAAQRDKLLRALEEELGVRQRTA